MVRLKEVADTWVYLKFGNTMPGNTKKNYMEYFLTCTDNFNPHYHIHLLTYDNGKAKLTKDFTHRDLMQNIFDETDAI